MDASGRAGSTTKPNDHNDATEGRQATQREANHHPLARLALLAFGDCVVCAAAVASCKKAWLVKRRLPHHPSPHRAGFFAGERDQSAPLLQNS